MCMQRSHCFCNIHTSDDDQRVTESNQLAINYESFINQFPSDTIKSMQQLERTYTKLCRKKCLYCLMIIYIYIFINIYIYIKVYANGPGDQGSIPGLGLPKTLKMVLDTSLLNTQQYKARIKGKVEQFRERSSL